MTAPNVRAIRHLQGRSLEDVAIEAGVSRETVRQVEIGGTVRPATRSAVLAALDVTDEFDRIYPEPERVTDTTPRATTRDRLIVYLAIAFAIGCAVGLSIASLAITTT